MIKNCLGTYSDASSGPDCRSRNEVAAGQAMQSADSAAALMLGSAYAPSMTVMVRDKAHGSRRVLERPWHCDLCLESSCSLAHLVQWSPELRTWYEQACAQSSCRYISATFQSLRAAKHRCESDVGRRDRRSDCAHTLLLRVGGRQL